MVIFFQNLKQQPLHTFRNSIMCLYHFTQLLKMQNPVVPEVAEAFLVFLVYIRSWMKMNTSI